MNSQPPSKEQTALAVFERLFQRGPQKVGEYAWVDGYAQALRDSTDHEPLPVKVQTFHIDSRGLVMEAPNKDGPYVATDSYRALLGRFEKACGDLTAARVRILDLEEAASALPPPVSDNPNEGPIVHGYVQVIDGVLPAFHNHWSCVQCGRRAEYVKENGCPESCGRSALTKGTAQ